MIGFDEIVRNKYMPVIRAAIGDGDLDSWSIVDLESEREAIEARLIGVDPQLRMKLFVSSDRGDAARALALVIVGVGGAVLAPGWRRSWRSVHTIGSARWCWPMVGVSSEARISTWSSNVPGMRDSVVAVGYREGNGIR
ncbi:hypothetical protein [Nocardia nepalensis]|uniref:hypothetical protein n=1 Tax=Nocardia nepalensis TaxID=3375448 RepID=UPI003B67F8B8